MSNGIPLSMEEMATLYSIRMLCFLEVRPQSNVYKQVLMDAETYKRMSFSFARIKGPSEGNPLSLDVEVRLSDDEFKLPDLQAIHEE